MPFCLNCGDPNTCDAHIIPAAIGKDMIKSSGNKLMLLAPDRKGISQSGFYDPDILCAACDNFLGVYDGHAIEITRLLGTADEVIDHQAGIFRLTHSKGVDHDKLALFGASVAWRASVSRHCGGLSGFTLGNNEPWFRDMIFRRTREIPTVTIARIVGRNAVTQKAAVDAMMYPVRVRSGNGRTSFARFYSRGLMFLVQTTRREDATWRAGAVTSFGKGSGPACLTGVLMPFDQLGGLQEARDSKYMQEILGGRE